METAQATGGGESATDAASTLGFVLAGVALAGCLLPWTDGPALVTAGPVEGSAAGAGLALVATLAFGVRRHGGLDRRVGGAVAGLCSLAVAVLALSRLVSPALGDGSAPSIRIGLPVAGVAALLGAIAAFADARGMTDREVWTKLRAAVTALAVGFLGFVVSSVIATVPGLAARGLGTTASIAALTAGSGVGMMVFTAGYLRLRGRGVEYVDLAWPDRRAAAYGVGGLVVLFLSAGLVSVTFAELGLPSAQSSIQELAETVDDPQFLVLVLVPLSFLAIAPGEELVYRNVVQKYLYEYFSRPTAVVVASVIFGVVHFQQYADPNPVATLSTLFVVFVLSLVLGYTYYRTENLLVPIFVHGAFNAIQFLALYREITGRWLPLADLSRLPF